MVVAAGLGVAGLPSNRGGFVEAGVAARGEGACVGGCAGKGFWGNAADACGRVTGKRLVVAVVDVVEVVGLSVPVAGALTKRLEEGPVAVDGVAGALIPPNSGAGAVVVVGVDAVAEIPPKRGFGAAALTAPPKSDEGGVGVAVGATDEGAVKRNSHQ